MQPAVVKTEDNKHGEGPKRSLVKTPDSVNLVKGFKYAEWPKLKTRGRLVSKISGRSPARQCNRPRRSEGEAIDTRVPASGLGES